ncbi:MAG: hypothetical protein B7Y25_06565 [Alphaproteobacteria bacterium 16-39-46]|nr:MAG: hypothetical protein B7Y25_06565 [Alphaproteobacteria bacterium 16-39-46]OZA42262.1 MAG: hypothetical protein B7X84_06630 [Alphaproteobacteria bacterium 17-39-52]HQS84548.1 tetratricopeptide repeat protein [Alphaproteobacteria bacterium]HQS94341.1 tetratricopeptide repeat protein [Alphaproteobacteria bacterium]
MQERQPLFPHDFYLKHLSQLKNIHFTAREIDVMACIMSARRTSKIASFLSINPRTVETHIRNIMLKLECNSQEGIIDFIETSDKLPFLRKYYALLRIQSVFEKSLDLISKLNSEKGLFCFLTPGDDKDSFISHLISHLKRAGIRTSSMRQKKGDSILFVLPKDLTEEETLVCLQKIKKESNKIIFLLQNKKNNTDIQHELRDCVIIDFSKQENYYLSFFNLLKKLIPDFNFDKFISEFQDKYKIISLESKHPRNVADTKNLKKLLINRRQLSLLLLLFVMIFLGSGFLALQWYQQKNQNNPLRSDLILPRKSILLNRMDLLDEIDKKLKENKGIQTIALVGVGGAGKTTVARSYAHQQKINSVIWEINAETHETLNDSFEKLAHAFAKTEMDQKTLKGLLEINDPIEKEDRIIQFVKERLLSQPNWLLIYDNVVTFHDIQKYFPYDPDTWGTGKIILTTRDSNIENNGHVDHIIFVGELSPHQKITLFTKIMTPHNTHPYTNSNNEEVEKFLEKIPSFPLDVSLAAYYLKATNVPYSTYLKNLTHFDKDFTRVQESILREAGEYSKVRYCIITTSLRKILETHPEFEELLLFMMLLNSQKIPRDLLNNLKGDVLVSHFIFNLKKYSLLTSEFSDSSISNSEISIHRSTQAIGLAYLLQKLGLEKSKELIKMISEKLLIYIDQVTKEEDLNKMKSLMTHSEAFLKHKNLLVPEIESILKGQLGIIGYFFGDNLKAKLLFEESLLTLEKFYEKYPTRVALFMGYLGNTLRDLGDYHKAKMLIENAVSIYEKYYPQDNLKHAYFLVYLGIVERFLGHYDLARNAFEKGIFLNKKHFPENENYAAWAAGQLAILDRELGYYEEAKKTLEISLKSFKKERLPDHIDIAWALEHLGVVYTKLGQYEKAKEALEQSLKIYAVYLPDQIGPSWILAHCHSPQGSKDYENVKLLFNQLLEIYKNHFHDNYIYAAYPLSKLGNLYREIGNYEKAEILLKQSLAIYQKNYGDEHLAIAQTLSDLGYVYLLQGKLNDSEELLTKSLKILEESNHAESYACLEKLSELFLKKSSLALDKGNKELSQSFKSQALSFLKQALQITKNQFGENSPHTIRVEEKIKNFGF